MAQEYPFYKAEYIWVDGTQPTHKLRSKTQDRATRSGAAHLGLRRLEHPASDGRSLGLRAQAGIRVRRPDPRRRQQAGHVRGAAGQRRAASVQHPRGAARESPSSYEARHVVRHRAGVHVLRRHQAARLARQRLPRAAGRLLLRRRRRRGLRAASRRGAPRELPQGGSEDLGHQRRGHARPVGVPGRPGRPRQKPPISCGSRAGCSIAPPRTSRRRRAIVSRPRSIPSRSRATGTAPAATPTSRPRRCASTTTPASRAAEALGDAARPAHRQLRRRHRGAADGQARDRPRGRSSATASRIAARRCASRGRSPRTRRATSRIAGRTPTWTRTS